jgi:hypothetical protein
MHPITSHDEYSEHCYEYYAADSDIPTLYLRNSDNDAIKAVRNPILLSFQQLCILDAEP